MSRHSDIAEAMTIAIWAAGAFTIVATASQVGSILIAIERCRVRRATGPAQTSGQAQTALGLLGLTRFLRRKGINLSPWRGRQTGSSRAPGVSIVRPVCGIENYGEETLHSAFLLDYPQLRDHLLRGRRRRSRGAAGAAPDRGDPEVPARLLIGNDRSATIPSSTMSARAGVRRHDWLVMADSNVLMPRDYIQRLLAAWRDDTGLVASPPVGCRPHGSGPSSNARFSTPTRPAGNTSPTASAWASPRASRCSTARATSTRPAGSPCWRQSRPRTPPRPRSCAPRAAR